MTPFFDFYREVTAFYVPELTFNSNPALRSHDDLRRIIQYIKDRSDDTRLQLTKQHFEKCAASNPKRLPSNDQNRAFNIAARIMTMLTCSTEGQSDGLLEAGSQPTPWYNDQSFNQFIKSAISKQNTVAFELHDSAPLSMKLPPGSITAKRLRKLAKLKIIPTNDLRNHLLLDETGGTVSIYHYTSILRQQLRAYQDGDVQKGSGPTTGHKVILSKELIVETLNTLKCVIFPMEPESQSILRSLVARDGFDPDSCRLDASSWQHPEGDSIRYEYWGSRLLRLYDELENPTPRGFLESWLERRSGARYVMLVTLAGVVIAILLGILGLAVGIFQAWISWQQWQHPIA